MSGAPAQCPPTVALIGYRGSGKSTVGRLLADRVGGVFVDTDELVVRGAGRTIAALFESEGEPAFRDREAEAVREAFAMKPAVVSLGGGAVLRRENAARVRASATVFYLSAPPEVLFERIMGDARSAERRPALTADAGIEEVRRVLAERDPLYRDTAHHVVDVTELSPEEVADRIADLVRWDVPPS